jgi:hypothetical protein
MAESPQRSADGGKGSASTPTRLSSVTLSAENTPTRSRPSPHPRPATSGAPRTADGRRRPISAARLPDGSTRAVCRWAMTAATATTTTRPMAAQPRR